MLASCNRGPKPRTTPVEAPASNKIIIDSHYTFRQAIEGSKAPQSVIDKLVLFPVRYYSTDGKIHQGQILANKAIQGDIIHMFNFMLAQHFPVAHAIPIVKYGWNDDLSMQDNNTSSFCYRDVSYSFHAEGLAIDINPYFNPQIWKPGWNRINKPQGAAYNPAVKGTFTANSPVVLEFEKMNFHWGGKFSAKYDYQHFEKAGYFKPQPAHKDTTEGYETEPQPDPDGLNPDLPENTDNNATEEE